MKQFFSNVQQSAVNLLSGKRSTSSPVSSTIHSPSYIDPNSLEKRLIYLNVRPPADKINRKGKLIYTYPSNKIITGKYTIITFIPKNLFEQFRRLANFFFLALVVLQSIPQFEISNPVFSALPITFIVTVTAIKDAFEDWKRHKSDDEINSAPCFIASDTVNYNHLGMDLGFFANFKMTIYFFFLDTMDGLRRIFTRNRNRTQDYEQEIRMDDISSPTKNLSLSETSPHSISENNAGDLPVSSSSNEWQKIHWDKLRVGDIVYLRNNDAIPADIVILSSSEPDSLCYVESKNLDGETNLKIRSGFADTTWIKKPTDMRNLKCVIETEVPNVNIYNFSGALHIPPYGNVELTHYLSDLNTRRTSKSLSSEDSRKKAVIPITTNELLLRGCVLRNTDWVIGVVIFTGSETKLILNSGETPSKRSEIEKKTNNQVIANFSLLILLCLVVSIANGVLFSFQNDGGAPYIPSSFQKNNLLHPVFLEAFSAFWISLILLQNLVPISLYVTTEMVKSFQAYFIYSDIEMYYEPYSVPCVPKTWTIADDLGQIEYLFSDKTGTLTQNIMEFRKCSIGGVAYGGYHTTRNDAPRASTPIENNYKDSERRKSQQASIDRLTMSSAETIMVDKFSRFYKNPYASEDITFVDTKFVADLFDEKTEQSRLIREFFTHVAACHTVLSENPDPDDDTRISYQAQSPDENALVATARDVGFVFIDRDQDSVMLNVLGNDVKFKILNVIEFTSSRKRMSVILRSPNGSIVLYSKGADSVICERLKDGQDEMKATTMEHLEMFASDGLRTLCLAYRILSEHEYENWALEFHNASTSIHDREKHMENVASKIEQQLILLGATAIEDQLQEGVPDCIETLSQSGIKIWVLTGDKLETAINIGFSCKLLTKDMVLIVIKGTDFSTTKAQIEEALKKCFDIDPLMILGPEGDLEQEIHMFDASSLPRRTDQPGQPITPLVTDNYLSGEEFPFTRRVYSLIIDGHSLKYALDHRTEKLFVELACLCKAVMCCRVSPLQKAQVVNLIKTEKQAITLAIGDGANDVSMIQAANVGIGILGQEGRQAVMASDYAIAQFRYLKRLLLVHGRWSYFRTAEMTLLMFYKNIIWAMIPFWFQIFCGWSAELPFNYFFIMTYNLILTSLPPVIIGVLDQDVNGSTSLAIPALYHRGIRRELYGTRLFFIYILDGLYQSLVCFFVAYFVLKGAPSGEGYTSNIAFFGTLAASIAVINCNLYMGFQALNWTWLHFLAFFGSPIVFYIAIFIYSYLPYTTLDRSVFALFGNLNYWLSIPLSVVLCHLPSYVWNFIKSHVQPDDIDILREILKYKLEDEWKMATEYFSGHKADTESLPFSLSDNAVQNSGPGIIVTSPSPFKPLDKEKEKDETDSPNRPASPIQKLNTEFDKWVATPIKRRLSKISPTVSKATSLMFMKTGKSTINTGFAFSQEPGLARHLRNISLAGGTSSLRRRKRNLSSNEVIVPKHFSASENMLHGESEFPEMPTIPRLKKQHGLNRWSIAGNTFGPVPLSPLSPIDPSKRISIYLRDKESTESSSKGKEKEDEDNTHK